MKNIKKKYKIENDKFTLLELIVIVLAFSVLSGVITGFVVYKKNNNNLILDDSALDILNTYNQIKNEYYKDVDTSDIADKAIDAMMDELGEKYSVYMDEDETNSLNESLNGTYSGIGVKVESKDGIISVSEVYSGTPAEKAGMKKGDILVKIDDHEVVENDDLEKLSEYIIDDEKVKIIVKRDDKELTFDITLTKIEVPVIDSKLFETDNDKKIGYIYISSFSSSSSTQFKTSLESLEKEGISSLIIDVRSNTGGYLTSATDIISMFVKKNKVIYSLEDKNGTKDVYDITDEKRTYDIVVITNEQTASASEILATSLKDNYGAIIVGSTTYGKGKVQQTTTLSNQTLIKYTTANWYRSTGESIDEVGLVPDIEEHLTQDYLIYHDDNHDAQLQKALEVLNN